VDNRDFIRNYLSEASRVAGAIPVEDIERAVEILFHAWENGNHVFTCGNGGSASTATHFACDLIKTVAAPAKRGLKAECLNDNIPLMLALINDEGFDALFYEQLKTKFQKGDVLICISVHGGVGKDKAGLWSQNLLRAIKYASDNGGKTIGLSGFDRIKPEDFKANSSAVRRATVSRLQTGRHQKSSRPSDPGKQP